MINDSQSEAISREHLKHKRRAEKLKAALQDALEHCNRLYCEPWSPEDFGAKQLAEQDLMDVLKDALREDGRQ